jgi:hypothetical protein
MDDMPRPRPPYLSREVSRHGRAIWYVRRNGKRIRLRADFGTPEFDAEYQAACNGIRPQKAEGLAGTLGWLVARYRETEAWQTLSLATRQRREVSSNRCWRRQATNRYLGSRVPPLRLAGIVASHSKLYISFKRCGVYYAGQPKLS